MSNLENCPTCGNPTSENAEMCPSCGEPFAAGWADDARRKRLEAEEANRLEAEERERQKREAVRAKKKAKWKRRIIFVGAIALLILGLVGKGKYDDYYERNLKEIDPIAFDQRINELETEVAKVPASNFDENIRLYSKLQNLDPENERYLDKISHYRERKKAAALEAEKAATKTKKEIELAEAAAKAEERRKGFHCLDPWNGSHRQLVRYAEEQMRDPDSFEHMETQITPVNANKEHTLIMKYRAKNGFGGMNVGILTATINNADCGASIISID